MLQLLIILQQQQQDVFQDKVQVKLKIHRLSGISKVEETLTQVTQLKIH